MAFMAPSVTFRILQLGMKAMPVPQRTITSVTWIRICRGEVLSGWESNGVNMKATFHCYTLLNNIKHTTACWGNVKILAMARQLPWLRLAALTDFLVVAKSHRSCWSLGVWYPYGIHIRRYICYIDCNRPCICLIRKYSHRYIRMWYVCASIDDTPLIVVFANACLQERCIQIMTYMSWIICSITMITRYY